MSHHTIFTTPRGRGTAINPDNRFAPTRSEAYDDGWEQDVPATRATEVRFETAKTVLTRNQSPDVGFDRSVNPYRGCEHGWMCSAIGAIESLFLFAVCRLYG